MLAAALALLATPGCKAGERAGEAGGAARERMAWWREARVGMFVHWGLYSIPAGEWDGVRASGYAEWIRKELAIPAGEYEALAERFDPDAFDAAAWARLARDSGMRYVVLVAKHHDGFAMWSSAASGFDVVATPFRRDVVRELSEAVRAEGLEMGVYYSILDWHHDDAQARFFPDYEAISNPDWRRYVSSTLMPQVAELLGSYGRLGVLWFDGQWTVEWTDEQGDELEAFVRALDPAVVLNDRLAMTRGSGDFTTAEQVVPEEVPPRDWESCMTLNGTWGYSSFDESWKSPETVVRTLVEVASKGGNLLLNVGPRGDGSIPEESASILRELGRWLATNGEAIYGTSAVFAPAPPWGRLTARDGRVYAHVLAWPAEGRLVVPLGARVSRASLLADPDRRALPLEPAGTGYAVGVPLEAPDPIATVIVLETE